MTYSIIDNVKRVLHFEVDDNEEDEELTDCITSADALIDAMLGGRGLTPPTTTNQNLKDASANFAAYFFKSRRGGGNDYYFVGMRCLDAYINQFFTGKLASEDGLT